MPDCPPYVIWKPVPPGSKLCAESSARDGDTPSDDYDSGLRVVQPGDIATDWAKSDLDPGPACLEPLKIGGYGARGKLYSGPTGPTVTLHVWIEAPGGSRPFDCTWTNSNAGTESHADIVITVKA